MAVNYTQTLFVGQRVRINQDNWPLTIDASVIGTVMEAKDCTDDLDCTPGWGYRVQFPEGLSRMPDEDWYDADVFEVVEVSHVEQLTNLLAPPEGT